MIHLAYYARVLVSLIFASFLSVTASYLALSPATFAFDISSSQTNAPESTSTLGAKQKQRKVNPAAQQPGNLGDNLGRTDWTRAVMWSEEMSLCNRIL